MKKIKMLTKISLKYWLHHKRRLFTLMLSLVFGVSALCCTALLVRSEKDAVLEEELRLLGDYDSVVYGASDESAEKFRAEKDVSALGVQYELGYVKKNADVKAYAAAFKDKQSEDIYHMTCTRGHYPEKENEIAMDLTTAKSLGIKPYPNEKVTLSLYSSDDKKIADKEYTLCGVFEQQDPSLYGGWLRYPATMAEEEYNMPAVYFHISQNEIFKSKNVNCYIQTEAEDLYSVYWKLRTLADEPTTYEDTNGRRYAYSYVMGNIDTMFSKYDGFSISNFNKAIQSGDTVKDFYSQVLMPVLTIIVFIIIILSIVGLTKNIIKDKQDNFAVLRSLGLEQRHLTIYIFADFTITALVCIGIGLTMGSLAHIGLIDTLNKAFDLKLNYGFSCIKYIKAVTFDPFVLSIVTILACVEISVFIALFSFLGKSPVQMFSQSRSRRRRFRRNKPAGKYRSWKWLLIRRIKLRNVRIVIVSILVMSVALTGYTYFQALARKQNNDLYWEKKNSGLEYWDYKAEKNANNDSYVFGIENHHENGVTLSNYEKLKEKDYVKDAFGRIVNGSTRLSFKSDEFDEKTVGNLGKFSLKKHSDIDTKLASELEIAQKESEEAMIEKIGYNKTDNIYSCPSVALLDDALDELEPFVIDGKIDKQKLKDGSEVLLVMDITNKIKFEKMFKAGDNLPLSDIVLNEKEEQLDFSSLDFSQLGEPVYQKKVKNYEGEETEERSYAIGKRKDIDVKIGAVLVLDLDIANKYMTYAAEGDHGLNVFCLPDSFRSWGIGERNLTEVAIKLTDDSKVEKADEYWYTILSDVKGMKTLSTADITSKMNRGTHKVMSIYYAMIVIVTMTATVMIAISLYTDIRLSSGKFAMLRACGMSTKQILFMIWQQNIVYPFVGAAFSIFPVMWCQKYLDYIEQKLVSKEWTYENAAWAFDTPYYCNLYDYNVKRTLLI
nr:FtsX-like permease family protein [Ruminococcus sp.]